MISASLLLISCPAAPPTGEGASDNYCIYVFLVLTPRNASVVSIYYNSHSQEKETAYSITREETAYSITREETAYSIKLGMWAKYTYSTRRSNAFTLQARYTLRNEEVHDELATSNHR